MMFPKNDLRKHYINASLNHRHLKNNESTSDLMLSHTLVADFSCARYTHASI